MVQKQKPGNYASDGPQQVCLKGLEVTAVTVTQTQTKLQKHGTTLAAATSYPCTSTPSRALGSVSERLFEGMFGLRAEKRAFADWQRWVAEFVTLLSSRHDISNFTRSSSEKLCRQIIIKRRHASTLPLFYRLRRLYSLILQSLVKTHKRHREATFPEEAVKRRGKKPAVNLLLRREVKRCNLLLSFVPYRGSCSPGFSWGSLTFPAMFLWLGAHLTPIKPPTCKCTDGSGAGWKVCFFFFPSFAPSSKPELQPSGTYQPCESQWRFSILRLWKQLFTCWQFPVLVFSVLAPGCSSRTFSPSKSFLRPQRLKNRAAKQRQRCISTGQTLKGNKIADSAVKVDRQRGSDATNPQMPGRKWHSETLRPTEHQLMWTLNQKERKSAALKWCPAFFKGGNKVGWAVSLQQSWRIAFLDS